MASRVLVYRIGSLGDTMIAVPAIHALRVHFGDAHLALLGNRTRGSRRVLARVLFERSGLFDGFIEYYGDLGAGSRRQRIGAFGRLLRTLRLGGFDTLVYLAPADRTPAQVRRDRLFFRMTGIRTFIGMTAPSTTSADRSDGPIRRQPHEAAMLLRRLERSGIPMPSPSDMRLDLGITEAEREQVARWRTDLGDDGGRLWIGVGPGSKMPVKIWPLERFSAVISRLIERYDVWPVVFGGPEDRDRGLRLVSDCGRGFVAAGELDPRQAATALESCALYIGNDTGTMHLASSAGVPCVAIFTARDWPGKWEPLGPGHTVLRRRIDCEGCMLERCTERRMECILDIDETEVEAACRSTLDARLSR